MLSNFVEMQRDRTLHMIIFFEYICVEQSVADGMKIRMTEEWMIACESSSHLLVDCPAEASFALQSSPNSFSFPSLMLDGQMGKES